MEEREGEKWKGTSTADDVFVALCAEGENAMVMVVKERVEEEDVIGMWAGKAGKEGGLEADLRGLEQDGKWIRPVLAEGRRVWVGKAKKAAWLLVSDAGNSLAKDKEGSGAVLKKCLAVDRATQNRGTWRGVKKKMDQKNEIGVRETRKTLYWGSAGVVGASRLF